MTSRAAQPSTPTARLRVAVAAAAGAVAAALLALSATWPTAVLAGWDVAATVYAAWLLLDVRHMDAARTASMAVREDPGRATADALVIGASVASLLAIGLVILQAGNASGAARALLTGLSLVSVLVSWAVIHATYTVRYARLYYTEPVGGVTFAQPDPPRFMDFAYLAFTIGMTFQVADNDLTTDRFRARVLGHALLSYIFGAFILATMINLVAGLGR
jgi:uncharacterized membrane protein